LPQQVHHFFVSEQESATRSPLLNYRPKTQRHCAIPLPDKPRHTRRIQSGYSQFQTRHLACLATTGTATTDSMARAVGAFCAFLRRSPGLVGRSHPDVAGRNVGRRPTPEECARSALPLPIARILTSPKGLPVGLGFTGYLNGLPPGSGKFVARICRRR
jgi:hypothetical protein